MCSSKFHLHWLAERDAVGIADIDSQHREIALRLNRIIDHIVEAGPCKILIELFDDLLDYVARHFAFEEDLMRRYEYPETAFHVDEHAILLKQLGNIIKKDPCSPFRASLAPAFLIDWVENHALKEDTKLGAFLAARGHR